MQILALAFALLHSHSNRLLAILSVGGAAVPISYAQRISKNEAMGIIPQ